MHQVLLIGYGGMGQWHARHVRESGFAQIACVFDIDPEKRALAAAEGYPVCDTLEQLFGLEGDICIVSTPNDSHLALVTAALEAGKHVLVEKPIACTMEQVDQMYDTARSCGKLLCVHQNRRWDVDYLAMKGLIRENRLGEVFRIESRIHGSRGIPSGWRNEAEKGGGMLLDWGIHLVDQMLLLFEGDRVDLVQCTVSRHTTSEVDDGFYLTLHMESGACGYVEVSTCNFIPLPRFYMTCRKGTAVIEDWRRNAQVAECIAWDEGDVQPERRGAGTTKTMAPRDSLTVRAYELPRPELEPYRLLQNFCNAIDGKEPLLITEDQVKQVFAVLMAAFRSAENGGALVKV